MTTATIQPQALLAVPQKSKTPAATMIVDVARRHKLSPFRQMREGLGLAMFGRRMTFNEYYSTGIFDPSLSPAEKRTYVGEKGSLQLNNRLSPLKLTRLREFARDKVFYTSLIRQLGFRTTETQAAVSDVRRYGAVPTFRTEAELENFFRTSARYPLFGKPTDYSGSYGSALFRALEGDNLLIGNGKSVPLAALCREIMTEYRSGYLLQSVVTQHPDLAAVTGDSVGSLRLVTVREDHAPRLLYSAWKIPAPGAMSDNFWQSGSMIAPIEVDTGKVGRCRVGTGLDAKLIDEHPVSGARLTGMQVPFWQAAVAMAEEAHALTPEFGVIGWDIAVTPDGPLIIELNANPHHGLYQLSHGRGILNADFTPVFDRIATRSEEMLAEKTAGRISRIKEQKKQR